MSTTELEIKENHATGISPFEPICEMDVMSPCSESDFNGNLDADAPAQIETCLDFIDINKEGCMFLGSSNLRDRYWNGSVWYFDDPKHAPNVLKAKSGHATFAGVSDGKFITETTAVMGMDGGHLGFVSIIKNEDGKIHINSLADAEDHSDSILSLSITSDRSNLITSSLDCSIRLWDCESTAIVKNLMPAHGRLVYCTDPHPTNPQIFLSASLDGNVLIWDLRCTRPASCVYRDYNNVPTSVSWVPGNEQKILVGVQSGDLHLRDSKLISENLHSTQLFNKQIFRMIKNKYGNEIAICANDSQINIVEVTTDEIKSRYQNNSHADFVRGFAWKDRNTVFSCGWDKMVHCHVF